MLHDPSNLNTEYQRVEIMMKELRKKKSDF